MGGLDSEIPFLKGSSSILSIFQRNSDDHNWSYFTGKEVENLSSEAELEFSWGMMMDHLTFLNIRHVKQLWCIWEKWSQSWNQDKKRNLEPLDKKINLKRKTRKRNKNLLLSHFLNDWLQFIPCINNFLQILLFSLANPRYCFTKKL